MSEEIKRKPQPLKDPVKPEKNWVRTMDGHLSNKPPVGYCKYGAHRGLLTRYQLEKHNCDLKHCQYFVKYKDNPYWKKTKENAARDKKREKKYKKKKNKVFY